MSTFLTEAEMTSPAYQWLRNQGLRVGLEYASPWGVIDLVGVSFSQPNVALRRKLGQKQAVGPQQRVAVLLAIPDEHDDTAISINELHSRFDAWMDRDTLLSHVRTLHQRRFLQYVDEENFQRVNGWHPLQHEIVTVELKLTDISCVIRQAQANLQLSTRAYIGLPCDVCTRLSNRRLDELSELGIGLLSVDPTGCTVVIAARRTEAVANAVQAAHCCERFWRTL